MAKITLESISKSFGSVTVIPSIDMQIDHGEFVVFVGPSGCGKSTLLRMIAGLETVSSGTLRIDGEVANDVDVSKRGLAMVFQSYALYPHMTVHQNVGFSLRMAGLGKAEIDEKVQRVAKILKLDEYLHRRPAALSGGQRQRVAIGRAIIRDPKAFLFDEPLSNLDAELRGEMRLELAKLHGDLDATMIYVTHDQIEAMTLADKIAVLRQGEVMQFGTPKTLFDDPDSRFVAGFLGSPRMNFLDGTIVKVTDDALHICIDGNTDELIKLPGKYAVPTGAHVSVGIRPQHVSASDDSPFQLAVSAVEAIGTETHVIGAFGGLSNFTMTLPSSYEIRSGGTVTMDMPAEHVFLFSAGDDGQRLRGHASAPQKTVANHSQ